MKKPKPYLTRTGVVFPMGMDDKYKWWADGQSFEQTLKELEEEKDGKDSDEEESEGGDG